MNLYRPSQYPRREPSFPGISTAQLGMYIALASLSMLFGASLVAYFITRAQSEVWREQDLPGLPPGLVLSTLVLGALSWALHYAERRLRVNDQDGLKRGLGLALGAATLFLLTQVQNWRTVANAALAVEVQSLYLYTFYMLTALHALHVIAGFIPLAFVYSRSAQYSSSRNEGVRLTRQYWDFLLVVWLILLLSLGLFS